MDQKIKDFAREISQQFPISVSDAVVFLNEAVQKAEQKVYRDRLYAEIDKLSEEYKGRFIKIYNAVIKISKFKVEWDLSVAVEGHLTSSFMNDFDYTSIEVSANSERYFLEKFGNLSAIREEIEKSLITEDQAKEFFQEHLEIVKKNAEKLLF